MTQTRSPLGAQAVQEYILNTVTDRDRLYLQFELFLESFRTQFDRTLQLGGIDANPESAHFRVLDLGCGEGLHLADIVSRYPKVQGVGIDRDAEAISTSREAFGATPELHFYRHDIHQPFPEEWEPGVSASGFDVVQMRYALAHLNAPVALARVKAALRTGGMVCLMDPLGKTLEHPHPSLMFLAEAINSAWRLYGTFDAGGRHREVLEQAGFEVLETSLQYHTMGGPTERGVSFLMLFLNLAVSLRHSLVDRARVVSGAAFDEHLERLRTECTPEMVGHWAVGQTIARKP